MHGIIHLELKNFVEKTYGSAAWSALVHKAGLEREIYTPLRTYPDHQLFALLAIAVELTGLPRDALLEQFGEFVVPTYLNVYGSLLDSRWRTLEVIEHTEATIHRIVRVRQPGAAPPRLSVTRTDDREVVVTYDSERRLCAVARGISRGLARHFGEEIAIDDLKCMLRGDPACVISVRLVSGTPSLGNGSGET